MNARIREKQAAYLAAMGREPQAQDPRGGNVVDLRPCGVDEADEVTVTFDQPRRGYRVRGKTTRLILSDLLRALGRPAHELVATPTKQGGFDSAWIKVAVGPDAGKRLAFVTGLDATVINIVWGRPIDRLEQVMGRFYPLGSSHATEAKAKAKAEPESPDPEIPPADEAELSPETETSGDDE